MRVLRILMAGLIALVAMAGVLLAALVVFFTGLAALVLQLFRGKAGTVRFAGRAQTRRPPPAGRSGEVIDVVTTKVPDDPFRTLK